MVMFKMLHSSFFDDNANLAYLKPALLVRFERDFLPIYPAI
jgi:hypothetical protein